MNIPSNNNNQASVPVKIHLNKESNQIFNNDTVNEHVSTTNNDVGIPSKIKYVNIPRNINVSVSQNENVNIPFNNNNQLSVPVKVHLNKESNQIFNSDTVNEYMSTSNNDIDIPSKIKDVNIPRNINVNVSQNENVNIPSVNVNIH